MDIKPLLKEAKRLLKKNPRDDIHDLSHHQRIWSNVQTLIKSIEKPLNLEVLQVATMWHDVMIHQESLSLGEKGLSKETREYLQKLMQGKDYDQDFMTAVLNAIKQHGFLTKYQMTLEGKILFDADKLDALNPIRYRRIIAGIKNKRLSKVQTFLIANAAKLWLRTMKNRYHLEKSKKIHDQLIRDLQKDKEAIQVAKEWGVDIEQLVK